MKKIKVLLFIIISLLYFHSFLYRLYSCNLQLQTDYLFELSEIGLLFPLICGPRTNIPKNLDRYVTFVLLEITAVCPQHVSFQNKYSAKCLVAHCQREHHWGNYKCERCHFSSHSKEGFKQSFTCSIFLFIVVMSATEINQLFEESGSKM